MRPERLYLHDIMDACQAVADHVGGQDEAAFVANPTARAAVLHELTIIGEAAARLSAELRERHRGVPWRQITGFRNVIVHEYFGVSWLLVWQTAARDVPELRKAVFTILHEEFGTE